MTRPDPVTVRLTMPIQAHGREVRELTLRPITGRELRICGIPLQSDGDGNIKTDSRIMAAMIVELAAVPLSSVDQLEAQDWFSCVRVIQDFLAGTSGAEPSTGNGSSPPISTPEPSGATSRT